MRTSHAVQACALGILALGCADGHQVGAHVSNPARSWDVSLACGMDRPSDTLSGLDRCLLEAWQPCRIDYGGEKPWSVELEYGPDRRLLVEKRTGEERATRIYRHEAGLLTSVLQSGFGPFEETYEYDAERLVASDRTLLESARNGFTYDGEGRVVEREASGAKPFVDRYEWLDDRLTRLTRSASGASEVAPMTESVFTYGANGALEREKSVGMTPYVRTFTYDEQGRLDTETREGSDAHEVYYEWDGADRLSRVERIGGEGYKIDLAYRCN